MFFCNTTHGWQSHRFFRLNNSTNRCVPLHDLALVLQAVNALRSVRSFTSVEVWRPWTTPNTWHNATIEMTTCRHVDVSRAHPAVSLQIFHKDNSHLRVDFLQISGYKLSSPWGIGVFDLCPGQIFSPRLAKRAQ
jgi:hypothetical protein